MTQELET